MPHPLRAVPRPASSSPLILCDRLLSLAQEADRAGHAVVAEHLLHLAHCVLEDSRAAA